MYFRLIGYNIVYDVVVFYDIIAYIVAPTNRSKNSKKNDIASDIAPDIVHDIILIYLDFIRCSSHCSKQWRRGRWWSANGCWWLERLLRTGHSTSATSSSYWTICQLPCQHAWLDQYDTRQVQQVLGSASIACSRASTTWHITWTCHKGKVTHILMYQ